MATQDEKIKWVEGSPFMVDGFRFTNPRCRHYLLTHFHSDHTTGLYKSFSAGTIYTSQGTANLVKELIGVNAERVVALPMDRPVVVAGFELTLIDANHCPAAVMFVIRDPRPGGRITLHTGDFRADKSVCSNPVVRSLKGKVDSLYLDTTYCGPRHTFPSQDEVLAQAARLVRIELQRDPSTLFLVGTYSIGKERVLAAVAKAAKSRCLVTSRKARMMRLSGAWDNSAYATHDASTGGGLDGTQYASVRAVPLQVTNSPATLLDVLAEARAAGAPFTSVVGVRPTGWTHTNARKGGGGNSTSGVTRKLPMFRGASGAAESDAEAGAGAGAGVPAAGETRPKGGSQGLGDSFAGNVGDGGGMESPGNEDQDDEAAAWGGAEGWGGDEEEHGVTGAGEGTASSETGVAWSGKKPWVEGNARVYSLPYSEHSSYTQLKDFVRTVKPKAIVPTVNASSGPAVEKMMLHFLEFMDLSNDRKRLDSYFTKRPSPASGGGGGGDGGGGDGGGGLNRTPSAAHTAPTGKRPKLIGGTRGDSPYSAEVFPPANQRACVDGDAEPFKPPPILLNCANARVGDTTVYPVAANPYAQIDRPVALLSSPPPPPLPPRQPCGGGIELVGGGGGGGGGSRHAVDATAANSCSSCDSTTTVAFGGLVGRRGDATVEIDLVDVEAQKAIMADIERRKRHQQQQQDGTTATRPLAAVTRKTDQQSGATNHALPERTARRKANEPGSGRKQLSAASGGAGRDSSRSAVRATKVTGAGDAKSPVIVGKSGGSDATTNASGAGGYSRRAIAADKTQVPSNANIRDFFSRRD